MEFLTPVPVLPCPKKISHTSPVLMVGSCFSDYIGTLLKEERFPVHANPFGVLYNPFSVSLLLKRSLSGEQLKDDEIFQDGGIYKSFLFHSSFAAESAEELKGKAEKAFKQTSDVVKKASFLILTLGTARYYRHRQNGNIAANCHKQPRDTFSEILATPDDCTKEISELVSTLRTVNPDLFVIFTISPVRYLKDGVPGAQQDKAVLFVALERWLQLPHTYYFPAYEIVIDELRDYRFYASDMVHPSATATEYIYRKFGEACFSVETAELARKIRKLVMAKAHRPLFPQSESYREFEKNIQREQELLEAKHPEIRSLL